MFTSIYQIDFFYINFVILIFLLSILFTLSYFTKKHFLHNINKTERYLTGIFYAQYKSAFIILYY